MTSLTGFAISPLDDYFDHQDAKRDHSAAPDTFGGRSKLGGAAR